MTGLVSALAPHIENLLEVKHALGLPYTSSQQHLYAFDAMCAEDFPGQTTLDRSMAMRWATARAGEHVNGQMRRITPVRQLAKHMAGLGIEAYVIPPGIPGRQVRYRPHLYTHAQLRAIFDAADQVRPSPFGGRKEIIIPVIFRMIYCLGLRPGEARRLARTDIDLRSGTVHIRESKGHKDRLLYMSPDLHEHCRRYEAQISRYHPGRVAFFPNQIGTFYSHDALDFWFRHLLRAADVTTVPGANSPRVYDLRHAHVVETINRWTSAGKDPQALVMYLSMHLGHANTADTWYYFHLAADFHSDLRELANTGIEAALPEACHGLR